jgi:osmotically-inducible protein OsmY
MTPRPVIAYLIPLALVIALALPGCTTMAVGAASTTAVAAAQERTIGDAIDDSIIYTEVNHYLLQASIDLFQDVGVKVVEGKVLLTGSVPTPTDRIEAVRLTWQADGVKEVLNELQVTDATGIVSFATDSWISVQVKAKLLFDRDIRAINYSIETVNGAVYMIGIARDAAELKRATNHARTIKGVRKVISHVRIQTS